MLTDQFRHKVIPILVASLCLTMSVQTVSADPEDRELPRLAYLVAGGDGTQALRLVFLKHERIIGQSQAHECSFSGELHTLDLNDSAAEVEVHPIILDGSTRSLIHTHEFESGRTDVVVSLFGETSSRACRLTLTPTLFNPTLGTTVAPVRCCGDACDCAFQSTTVQSSLGDRWRP